MPDFYQQTQPPEKNPRSRQITSCWWSQRSAPRCDGGRPGGSICTAGMDGMFVMKLLMYIWINYNCMIWYVYNCMICMDGWMLGTTGLPGALLPSNVVFPFRFLKNQMIYILSMETWTSKWICDLFLVLQQLDSFTSLKIWVFPASNTLPARYRMRLLSWCLVHCPGVFFLSRHGLTEEVENRMSPRLASSKLGWSSETWLWEKG